MNIISTGRVPPLITPVVGGLGCARKDESAASRSGHEPAVGHIHNVFFTSASGVLASIPSGGQGAGTVRLASRSGLPGSIASRAVEPGTTALAVWDWQIYRPLNVRTSGNRAFAVIHEAQWGSMYSVYSVR